MTRSLVFGVVLVLLLGLLIHPATLEQLLRWILADPSADIYPLISPVNLLADHLVLVIGSSALCTLLGFSAGVLTFFSGFEGTRRVISFSGTILQTVPPMAFLALLIPVLGFGTLPVFWALVAFGVLPIFHGTLASLESVPKDVISAARGLGYSRDQIFRQVEVPLASSGILGGIRTSLLINIGTATIGATMGAGGLGRPILAGITQFQYSYLLQGALTAALLALLADWLFTFFKPKRLWQSDS